MPEIGAGAWISGLFHVEHLRKSRVTSNCLRQLPGWKNMWRTGTCARNIAHIQRRDSAPHDRARHQWRAKLRSLFPSEWEHLL